MMSKRIHAIQAIRWIFFDIGSTLVDEEKAYKHRIRDMIQDTSVTFEQFWDKRIQYAKAGYNGDQKAIEYFALNKTPWHARTRFPLMTVRKPCGLCATRAISLASSQIRILEQKTVLTPGGLVDISR